MTPEQERRALLMYHKCKAEDRRLAHDAQGIPLCFVCPTCEKVKLSKYRPEILTGYTQADVDEPIEPEYPEDWA